MKTRLEHAREAANELAVNFKAGMYTVVNIDVVRDHLRNRVGYPFTERELEDMETDVLRYFLNAVV